MKMLKRICTLGVLFILIHSATAATYTLTLNTNGNGTVARNPTNAVYPQGAVVTITALPAPGWSFDSWSGDAAGSTNPLNVTMGGNKTITANFSQVTLTVNVTGQGSVSPSGGSFSNGTVVQLTATPSNGWYFFQWTGDAAGFANPLNLTLTSNKTVTAVFINVPVGVVNFNVSTQFSAATNPASPWSYGWLPALGSEGFSLLTFQANNTSENGVPVPGWQFSPSQTPAVYSNRGTNTASFNFGQGAAFPGEVFVFAGGNGSPENYGVIRFVVPYAGPWHLDTAVAALYYGQVASDTDIHILTNGIEIYAKFLAAGATNSATNSFSTALNLSAGDIIDFAVGRGADGSEPGSGLKIAANLSFATTNLPPVITTNPQSIYVGTGGTAVFNVGASGTAPLAYQWYFNDGPVAGGSSALLTLTNVQPFQAGPYYAVVSNPYGSATSQVAILDVTNACQGTNLVTVCNDAALRQAVAIGGLIRFCCNGVITLANSIDVAKDTILDASGRSVVISGNNAVRLFSVSTNTTFVLSNLSLIGGSYAGTNATQFAAGAAIISTGGNVRLVSCVLSNNAARDSSGGAVACFGGSLTILNSLLVSNTARGSIAIPAKDVSGGALFLKDTVTHISDSLLRLNSIASDSTVVLPGYESPAQLSGGALAVQSGTCVLTRVSFSTNSLIGGFTRNGFISNAVGGAIFNAGLLQVSDCSFSGNAVQANGGLLTIDSGGYGGAVENAGIAVVIASTFSGNSCIGGGGRDTGFSGSPGSVAHGGALHNRGAAIVTNCTFSANSAKGGAPGGNSVPSGNAYGGGISSEGGSISIVNSTLASNVVSTVRYLNGSGFALGANVANTNGAFALRNSLLASASTNGNAWGALIDGGYNMSSDGSASFSSGSSFNFTDPKLLPLTNNGGPTLTMALAEDSPAIDWAPAAGAPATDQRGVPRPNSGANVVDLGAFEFTPPPPPPLLATRSGSSVKISFEAAAGKIYRLERCTDFTDWELFLLIGPVAESGPLSGTFPMPLPHQFFRLRWGP